MNPTNPLSLSGYLLLGSIALTPAGLLGQAAPSASSPAPATNEAIVLSEFRVDSSRDKGYTATNSITGTLLNTPLRDTPFAIDVYTEQFMLDLGATTFREVLQYDTSSVLDNTIVQGFNSGGIEQGDNINNSETDVKVRGFPVPTLTNGFRTQVSIDTIGLGRIERAGGPSSLLYGTGAISGITNNITKTSLPKAYYFGSLSVGTNNYMRAAFDASGPIVRTAVDGRNQLGYRVFGSWTEEETEREFYNDSRQFLGAVFDYRPFRSTEVILDLNTTQRRTEGNGPTDTSRTELDPVTGRNISLFADTFQQGRNVNFGGPDPYTDYDSRTYRAEVVQRIGENVTLLVAGQRETFDQERRSLESIDYNINNGTTAQYAWHLGKTDRVVDQFRANLLTKFNFFGKHALVVGRQEYSETVEEDLFQGWFRNYPTSSIFPELNTRPDGTNPMLGRTNLTPNARVRYAGETYVPSNALQTLQQWISGTYLIHQGQFFKNRLTTVLGYRWERTHNLRLHTVASNHWNTRSQNDRIWARSNASNPDDGGLVVDPLVGRGTTSAGYSNKGAPLSGEYPTASASFRLTEALSIYGQYAEGAALPSTAQRDGDGNNFAPNESTSEELGLKFEILKGKISGRVSAFRLERLNAVRYGFSLPAPYRGTFNPNLPPTFNMNAGLPERAGVTFETRAYNWNDAADRAKLIAWHDADRQLGGGGLGFTGGNNGHGNRGSYANFDEEAEGFEVQIDFNPIPAWSIKTSYTRNDVIVTQGISNLADQDQVGGFFSPFHPAFTTLGEGNFTNGPVLGNLASYTNDVRTSSFVDKQYGNFKKSDTPLHAFTVWNKYDFQGDRFRGLSLGGGARYQSERTTDFGHGRNDRPQEGRENQPGGGFVRPPVPESLLFDLFVGYQRRLAGRPWSFQLNVRNLLDDQKLQAIGLPPEGSALTIARTATVYLPPRDIRVTASVRF